MSERKHIVTWQNSYSVGIRLVDEQHMHLIKLTNRLFSSCLIRKEKTKSVFAATVREAVDYVGYHFSTEEKLMERVNYPEFRRHKQEHLDFVREVFSNVEEYNSGRLFAPLSFVYFLRDWILRHVAVTDKKMGDHLLMMKRTGELQKITLRVKTDESANRVYIK
ncbi:MAG: bacteriohemerythrin [Treponema sp.]|nr:bacteriohemerythrin [Treponema sp.]